jgi:casein kinase 1
MVIQVNHRSFYSCSNPVADKTPTEEFNKYLSYVRNLGFEDTPDYDYLRDLFTQALKNAGEIEDGEYDWMKLNNGRGWEYKSYASQHHHHGNNAIPNSLAREPHGTPTRGVQRPGITADRLNAAQPPPPSPAIPGVGKTRERPNASGGPQAKRQSGMAGGFETATPAASTQAQFQNSNAHLPGRLAGPGSPVVNNQQSQGVHGNESQPTFFQKVMRALCCGTRQKS